jgi:hypothetical protein
VAVNGSLAKSRTTIILSADSGIFSTEARAAGSIALPVTLRREKRLSPSSTPAPHQQIIMRRSSVTLNADVYAGDILRNEYRHQMDRHARKAEEAAELRDRLERVEAQQRTAAERATSIMETLARYGGMLAPTPSTDHHEDG